MRFRDVLYLAKGLYYRIRYPQIKGGKRLKVQGRIYVDGDGKVELGEGCLLDGRFGNPIVFRTASQGKILLGDNVFINIGCIFSAGSGTIKIGEDSGFGPRNKIYATNHQKTQEMGEKQDVSIGENSLVGTDCKILAGSELGKNCIIGAGTVIPNKKFSDNVVIAGNPAGKVKDVERVLE